VLTVSSGWFRPWLFSNKDKTPGRRALIHRAKSLFAPDYSPTSDGFRPPAGGSRRRHANHVTQIAGPRTTARDGRTPASYQREEAVVEHGVPPGRLRLCLAPHARSHETTASVSTTRPAPRVMPRGERGGLTPLLGCLGSAAGGHVAAERASAITAAVCSGASSGRRNTEPGMVTKVTLAAASSVARSRSVSPPSPLSA
jgi:hypothetical protein